MGDGTIMTSREVKQREFNRFPIEFEVDIYALKGTGRRHLETAGLQDVSGGGIRFFSTHPDIYTSGQRVFLSVHLPGTDTVDASMRGEATIIWIGERDEGGPDAQTGAYIGVCVDDLLTFSRIVRHRPADQDPGGKPA